MSLILKGINLPKEGELHLIVTKNGIIYGAEYPKVRHTYPLNLEAEAIQIPKGHGRLIDADKIDYDEFWHREGQGFTIAVCQGAEQIIKEQPTILESEE